MSISDAMIALAQFSLTLAGFIGALVTFVARGGEWHTADSFRTWRALVTSLGVGFMAMLPLALGLIGVAGPMVWRVSSAFAACFGVAWLSVDAPLYLRQRTELCGVVPGWGAGTIYFTATGTLVAQGLNAVGVWFVPQAGVYFATLLVTLLLPAFVLARIPFVRPAGLTAPTGAASPIRAGSVGA